MIFHSKKCHGLKSALFAYCCALKCPFQCKSAPPFSNPSWSTDVPQLLSTFVFATQIEQYSEPNCWFSHTKAEMVMDKKSSESLGVFRCLIHISFKTLTSVNVNINYSMKMIQIEV